VNEWYQETLTEKRKEERERERERDLRFFSLPLFSSNLRLGKSFFSANKSVEILIISNSSHIKNKIFTKKKKKKDDYFNLISNFL
jgi:hypothetical protein